MFANQEAIENQSRFYASPNHLDVWQYANLLYPQTINGFAGILGPYAVMDILSGRLQIDGIRKQHIPDELMSGVIERADHIHRRLGIRCTVDSGAVNQQWRATGSRIATVLKKQIEEFTLPAKH